MLKLKFKKLQSTVVGSVNAEAAKIIDFMFQEGVIGDEDMRSLHAQKDPRRQCRSLLGLLHTTEHPQAFVQLYLAVKTLPNFEWLVDRIDNTGL